MTKKQQFYIVLMFLILSASWDSLNIPLSNSFSMLYLCSLYFHILYASKFVIHLRAGLTHDSDLFQKNVLKHLWRKWMRIIHPPNLRWTQVNDVTDCRLLKKEQAFQNVPLKLPAWKWNNVSTEKMHLLNHSMRFLKASCTELTFVSHAAFTNLILNKSDANLSFTAFLVLYQSRLNLCWDVQWHGNMKLIFSVTALILNGLQSRITCRLMDPFHRLWWLFTIIH